MFRVEGKMLQLEFPESQVAEWFYDALAAFDANYIVGSLYEQFQDEEDAKAIDISKLRNDYGYAWRVAYKYREFIEESYGSELEWECFKAAIKYVDKCQNEL